jgi:hypothetical protein
MNFLSRFRSWSLVAVGVPMLLAASEQEASAQVLLAQSGTAKTAIGYGLTLLAILLGMVVVLRPSKRKLNEKKKQQPAAKR